MSSLLQSIYFWGLPASTVGAIFAGVGALIVGLYILKLRRRRLEVPFVGFWQQISRDASTSRLFRNLRRWLSLLLALFIAALLVLSLGDPRRFAERQPNRLIILLDVSASMQATDGEDAAATRFSKAQAKAREVVASMHSSDRAVLIAAGARPKPLTGLTDSQPVLIEAIERAQATGASLNLAKSLRIATDLAEGAEQARVVLISDGGYVDRELAVPQGLELSFIAVGKPTQGNVGITAMSARVHPLDARRNQVFVEVESTRKEAATVELRLHTAGRTLSTETLTLEPGQRVQRTMDDLAGIDEGLTSEILPQGFADPLAGDNQAHLVLPKRKRLRVGVVSDGNLYLQAALLLDEYLDVQDALTVSGLGSLDRYDALVFDNTLPPQAPPKPAIYINPDGRALPGFSPLEVTGDIDRPFVDKLEKDHPLLRWVALRDINIGVARDSHLQDGDVMVAGDRRGPLLVDGKRPATSSDADGNGREQRFFALMFDPRESDLPLRAAWPLLLISMLDNLVPQPVDSQGSCIAGQPCYLEGHAAPQTFDQIGIHPFSESGRLASAGSADHKALGHVAVNIDPRETKLTTREQIEGAAAELRSTQIAPSSDRLWIWLVALALLTLCLEWWSLQRRRTV